MSALSLEIILFGHTKVAFTSGSELSGKCCRFSVHQQGMKKKKKLTASEVWGIFAGHSHLGSANRKQHIVTTTAVKTIQFLLNVSLQVFFSAARECIANGLPRR